MPSPRRLTKSRDKVFFGVCGGLAEFIDWPPRRVRAVWALLTFLTGGGLIVAYLVLAFAMPQPTTFNIDDFREQ
jgi:phage shock protein C